MSFFFGTALGTFPSEKAMGVFSSEMYLSLFPFKTPQETFQSTLINVFEVNLLIGSWRKSMAKPFDW